MVEAGLFCTEPFNAFVLYRDPVHVQNSTEHSLKLFVGSVALLVYLDDTQ